MLAALFAAENEIAGIRAAIFWPSLIVGVIIAIVCAVIAARKGRSPVGWFILGLLFSVITLIVIALIGPKRGDARA